MSLCLMVLCVSGSDGGERSRREVVNACPGRVHIRQVGSSCTYHSHWSRSARPRYAVDRRVWSYRVWSVLWLCNLKCGLLGFGVDC